MHLESDPADSEILPHYSGDCDPGKDKCHQLFTIARIPRDDFRSPLAHDTSLFVLKYEVLPCVMSEGLVSGDIYDDVSGLMGDTSGAPNRRKSAYYYHTRSISQFLSEQYHVDPSTFFYTGYYDVTIDASVKTYLYVNLGNYLAVAFKESVTKSEPLDNPNGLQPDLAKKHFQCFSDMKIYHTPQSEERARTLLKQLQGLKIYALQKATLQMVRTYEHLGFHTTPIEMKKPHIIDLRLHYGDDFPDIHSELLEALQEKNSTGITFLHGPPGTGKTYYLRYLINEIKDKPLIYIPPDLVQEITKPAFLTFLMARPNSILIIEDAENIIHDRRDMLKSSNQAVSNLLNMSDGLLGDAVHQQIICTFNCDIGNIDSALVRDGRLVLEHKFDKLSVENARRLCEKLGVENKGGDIREPMSLAEIYARTNPDEQGTEGSQLDGTHQKKNRRTLRRSPKEVDLCSSLYS